MSLVSIGISVLVKIVEDGFHDFYIHYNILLVKNFSILNLLYIELSDRDLIDL